MEYKSDYFSKNDAEKPTIKPIVITNNSRPYYQSLARLGSAFSTIPREESYFSSGTQPKPNPIDESLSSPIEDQLSSDFNKLGLVSSPNALNSIEPDLSMSPTESFISRSITAANEVNSRTPSKADRTSPLISREEKMMRLRRVKTFAAESVPDKPSRSNRKYSQPITSASYNSMPKSDAVSFLSMFADSTASELNACNPDEEGQEVGDYVMGKILATGAFSTVREAYTFDENSKSPIKLAVKVIRKDSNNTEDDKIDELENEIILWKKLRHNSILKFVDVFENEYAMFIFMELCPNGTLLNYVLSNGKLSENEARAIFLPIAESVRYLHQDVHVIHRDLKLENIVLTKENKPKLTDFGLSQSDTISPNKDFPSAKKAGCAGSVAYCPPELFSSEGSNGYPSDIWSLGIILYALVTGEFPFSDGFEPRLVMKIRNGTYNMPETISPELQNLIRSMLSVNPSNRPTISQVLENTWFQN